MTEEAYRLGGADALKDDDQEAGSGLLLGALLDGIPESAVLGTTLLTGTDMGVPVLAAIFLSNLPL